VAARFATAGYALALVDADVAGGEAVAGELREGGADARFFAGDVADAAQVAALFDLVVGELGRISFVFHAAGVLGPEALIEDADDGAVARLFDVDLKGSFYVLKYAVRALKRSGGGAVVLVGSIAAGHGSTFYPAYCAAKAGLLGLTRSVARSAGRYNVRVNCLSPGSILGTRLSDSVRGRAPSAAERQRMAMGLMQKVPLGRAARPEDVADVALFLASPLARHIHGAELVVDGGERLGFEGSPSWRHENLGAAVAPAGSRTAAGRGDARRRA
jgi:meso-butanediol dehydrogenase/(S,S)-butanediol dehydrogenase/diacetyl reductase